MGYQVGSACYDTPTAAAQVSASAQIGSIMQQGSTLYVVDASGVDATSITYLLSPVGGGTAISMVAPYTAQPCNLLGVDDGLALGWGIGAAWLAAFALMFLARIMRGETGGDYGNT